MAALKHLFNNVDDVVSESLSGFCYAYPQLEYHMPHRVVLSPDYKDRKDKVAVVCGGGSGHEPFATGFVGKGMLTASVAGSIFAAPPSTHITHAFQCVSQDTKAGIFVIVPNYTGDRLNFGIAIEKARQTNLMVKEIIVGEDCSIPKEEQSVAGKRGLTGMVCIIKIAGALAERGFPLQEIATVAEDALNNMATYAVGLSACSIPGQGLMFELAQDEIEYGMGVHGETGYERTKLDTAAKVVARMLRRICSELKLTKGDSVAAIINNFGALSQLEQGVVIHEVAKQLENMGIHPIRIYSGVLVTSLNSAGIHITLLKLPDNRKATFISCLDDPTNAPSWPGCAYSIPLKFPRNSFTEEKRRTVENIGIQLEEYEQRLFKLCLRNACRAIIVVEDHLNELDRGCGDGDCGTTMKRLADGILLNIDNLALSHPSSLLFEVANIAEENMGGTSGALYCLLFTSAAKEIASFKEKGSWPLIWSGAFRNALSTMMKYGKSKPGDRTMLDSMNMACTIYENLLTTSPASNLYDQIRDAAWQGCEATKSMEPRVGRASYVKQVQYLQQVDAGAYAAAIWINAITETIKNFKK